MRYPVRTFPLALAMLVYTGIIQADDWPTFRHDQRRSAVTDENLPARQLTQCWVHQSVQGPQPAWDGPAKWDAYAGIRGLKSMRDYDLVFQPVIAGQWLYFGSTADDSVYCLNTRTGQKVWVFTTDGAVRIAPTVQGGRVYFGSDDGYVYCLEAAGGRLLWKFSPGPNQRWLLHNGRFIPHWPCRTGVLIDQGTAYCAFGMLPWKESYLCALDAATGKPDGPGRFVRTLEGLTFEGAMLASNQRLISPQGRVAPLLFNRNDGAPLGGLEGGGGCFVLLTEDQRILHAPGNKTGWVQESHEPDRTKVANFKDGQAMVVRGNLAYLLTDTALIALSRQPRRELWRQECTNACSLIVAGQFVYVGKSNGLAAFAAADGQPVWQGQIPGLVHGLAVADGALFASTDLGALYCFRPGSTSLPPSTLQPPQANIAAGALPLETDSKAPGSNGPPLIVSLGPSLRFQGPDQATVWWRTAQPVSSALEYGLPGEPVRLIQDPVPTTNHWAKLTSLKRDGVYEFRISAPVAGQVRRTESFELDTHFNYQIPPISQELQPYASDSMSSTYAEAADQILKRSGVRQGICLVLGCGEGRLAFELAKRSRLRVVGVETDPARIARARKKLLEAGVYGSRVAVHQVSSLAVLPLARSFANLIVSDRWLDAEELPAKPTEVLEYLRPNGGIACFGRPDRTPDRAVIDSLQSWLKEAVACGDVQGDLQDSWIRVVRGPLPGSGQWSHQYGDAANTTYGGESLQGACKADDLEVQWLGLPGPRAQADRNGRKPSPLSTNGRLFVQGLNRIHCLDAYNGSILWTHEIPGWQRFNLPRDCSNWCADDQYLYLAHRDYSWRLKAATGDLDQLYSVEHGAHQEWAYDWGFLSIQGAQLIGSAVKQGSAFRDFWGGGEAGWYDATSGPVTDKVCSDTLFALNRDSGARLWQYQGGLMVNPTITIENRQIFFVEGRHPKVLDSSSHRIGLAELWQDLHLVALDLEHGQRQWEVPIQPAAGTVALYLAAARNTLVLVASGSKSYHVYAYSSEGGKALWQTAIPWPKDNHGGHMSRPAIVGNTVYVRPGVFELATGKALEQTVTEGGCGTYAATDNLLIFRNSNVTLWDRQNGSSTSWPRLRPDCWLSTIPAAGLILAPEAGGGCSCGNWLETSIAFIPTQNGSNTTATLTGKAPRINRIIPRG